MPDIPPELRSELREMEKRIEEKNEALHAELKGYIASAYPDGDPVLHRLYHEEMIRWARARRQFFENLALHLAKVGAVGVIGVILIAVVRYVSETLGGGSG